MLANARSAYGRIATVSRQHLHVRGKTRDGRGLVWLAYGMLAKSKLQTPLSIAFAEVATHNHFVLDRGGKVFKQTAPVIKLPTGQLRMPILSCSGYLTHPRHASGSSKSVKASGNEGYAAGYKSEAGSASMSSTAQTCRSSRCRLCSRSSRARRLDSLAQQLSASSRLRFAPAAVPSREALASAQNESEDIRARMIAVQEELDWEVYRLYGLIDEDLTYARTICQS